MTDRPDELGPLFEPDDWDIDSITHRVRVITDNDYAGDPDGLVQLAQLFLSPNVDIRHVISSHLPENDGFDPSGRSAARGAVAATRIAEFCRRDDVPVTAGSETPLRDARTPIESDAARAIVDEAMRDDTDLPLFVTCGGGLTEIASALLMEPRIAQRVTLVWIGGEEYPDLASYGTDNTEVEYNTGIDLVAAQVVFDSDLPFWQVPRNVYRQAIASRAELRLRMRSAGPLGRHLYQSLGGVVKLARSRGLDLGEVFILGDSPLVLLTALWSSFKPEPASTPSVVRPRPRIGDDGHYIDRPDGAPVRVFTVLDNRLMIEDLYAKLAELAMTDASGEPEK